MLFAIDDVFNSAIVSSYYNYCSFVGGRSRSVLKVLGGGLLITAGAVGGSIAYAKANPEFRQQVESNWPILLPITSYIFDEMKPTDTPQLGGVAPARKDQQM